MCLLTPHRIFSGISVYFPSLFGPLPLSPWISLHVLVFFCDFYFSLPTTLKHYLFSFINLFLECISSASSVCIQAWDIFLDFLAEITACCANSTVAKKGERWYRKKKKKIQNLPYLDCLNVSNGEMSSTFKWEQVLWSKCKLNKLKYRKTTDF